MNRECYGDYYLVDGRALYRCFLDGVLVDGKNVISGDKVCPRCWRPANPVNHVDVKDLSTSQMQLVIKAKTMIKNAKENPDLTADDIARAMEIVLRDAGFRARVQA